MARLAVRRPADSRMSPDSRLAGRSHCSALSSRRCSRSTVASLRRCHRRQAWPIGWVSRRCEQATARSVRCSPLALSRAGVVPLSRALDRHSGRLTYRTRRFSGRMFWDTSGFGRRQPEPSIRVRGRRSHRGGQAEHDFRLWAGAEEWRASGGEGRRPPHPGPGGAHIDRLTGGS